MSEAVTDHLAIAMQLADRAGAAILPHFRASSLATEDKSGGQGFDPVTAADKAAEAAIRAELARSRPMDGIHGEEEGITEGTSGLTWVIDPIDGTRAFLIGAPTWGTLIGLGDAERLRLGVVDQCFTRERWWGGPELGAQYRGPDGVATEIATRPCGSLSEALIATTDLRLFDDREIVAFTHISNRAKLCRFGLDCYAYALLAMGQIDLVIESGLQPYDVGALIPLIEGAGGVMTGWDGSDCRNGGRAIAAGDPERHAEALALIAPFL